MAGFISDCGNYGVFQFGKQWMVIYHNRQLEVFKTIPQAKKYIKQHQDSLKTVTLNISETKTSSKIKGSSKRTKTK